MLCGSMPCDLQATTPCQLKRGGPLAAVTEFTSAGIVARFAARARDTGACSGDVCAIDLDPHAQSRHGLLLRGEQGFVIDSQELAASEFAANVFIYAAEVALD